MDDEEDEEDATRSVAPRGETDVNVDVTVVVVVVVVVVTEAEIAAACASAPSSRLVQPSASCRSDKARTLPTL